MLGDHGRQTRRRAPGRSPAERGGAAAHAAPSSRSHPLAQLLRFNQRQIEFVFGARRGSATSSRCASREPDGLVITSHPDHVRSLFTAKPEEAPSLAGESPLRPIVGPNSVLTALGPRHMRQRKLLLPPFHGEAIERYTQMIAEAAEREIDRWPLGGPFALAPRMQAITLDVIMAGIFGDRGQAGAAARPSAGCGSAIQEPGRRLDQADRPDRRADERRPRGAGRAHCKSALDAARPADLRGDRARAAAPTTSSERRDILSLLLQARTEEGEALSDHEIRDELLTLVLAGHETTANSLAWAWERLRPHTRTRTSAWSRRSAPATRAPRRRSRRRSSRRCARGR